MGSGRLLVVVILCFIHLTCINGGAIPIPALATRRLSIQPAIHQVPKRPLLEKLIVMRRMEIEVNDYPGSGANNRHTPRAQLGRPCTDC